MRVPKPTIRDFATFRTELDRAIAIAESRSESDPRRAPNWRQVRDQLIDAKSFTTGPTPLPTGGAAGRCPTDMEIARMTFGQFSARELDDDPEMGTLLGRLSDYLHQWPRGVDEPVW